MVSDVSRCGCLCVLLHGIQWNSQICLLVFSTKYGMIPALFHYFSSFFPLLTPTGSLCYICWWAWCCPTGIFLHFLQTFTFLLILLHFMDFFFYQLMSTCWATSKVSISVIVLNDFRISIGYFLLFLCLYWDSHLWKPFLSYFYLSLQTQFPSFFGYF